jgi:hypothetical protein
VGSLADVGETIVHALDEVLTRASGLYCSFDVRLLG